MPIFLFMCILYIDKNISFKVQITSQRRFFLLHIFKNLFYWSIIDLYLVSSASVRSIPFLSFIMLTFAWNVPLVSLIFLKRIDAFELWCWRRLLRVPWTVRRSNQLILKEISPDCSLEGLMLKLKFNTLATWWEEPTHWKDPNAVKDWGQEEKRVTED